MTTTRRRLIRSTAIVLIAVGALAVVFLALESKSDAATTALQAGSVSGTSTPQFQSASTERDSRPAAGVPTVQYAAPTSSQQARHAAAEALPFENRYILDGTLLGPEADRLLHAQDFERQLAALEQQMLKDPLAIEQRDAFAQKISGQLAKDPDGARLHQLVCGLSVCVGAMRSKPGESFDRWLAKQFVPGQPSDIQAFTAVQAIEVDGGIERRFAFSASPEVRGFTDRAR